MTQTPAPAAAPKTSGMAIASLVCGIVGFCTVGVGGLVGIVLGIVAIKKINGSGGALAGRGLSIGGIILSIVSLIAWAAVAAFVACGCLWASRVAANPSGFINTLQDVESQAFEAMTVANANQLTAAAAVYCTEHKDQFPPPDTWPQALTLGSPMIYAEPGKPGTRIFAMNAALRGLKQSDVPNPTQTVLFGRKGAGKCQ